MSKRDSEEQLPDVDKFTEDLASILGLAQVRTATWLGQRQEIIAHLEGIRDTASALLGELKRHAGTTDDGELPTGPRAAAVQESLIRKKRSKKRSMSPEARQRISESQKKRWAVRRARSDVTDGP